MNPLPPFSIFTGSKDLPYNVDKFPAQPASSHLLPPFSSLVNDRSEPQKNVTKPSSFLPKSFENHPLENSVNYQLKPLKASNMARKQTSNPVEVSQKESPKNIKRKQPEHTSFMTSITQSEKLLEKVEELRVLIYNSQELLYRKDIRDKVSQVEFSTKNLKDEFETQKLVNKKLKQEMDVLKNENFSLEKKNQQDAVSAKCLKDARENYIKTLETELSKLKNVNPITK